MAKNNKYSKTISRQKYKNFCLRGLDEVGKNMYCVEVDDELIVIDSGIMFQTPTMVLTILSPITHI